jgi:hypothetical protein
MRTTNHRPRLAELWNSYALSVLPPDCSAAQRRDCQRCFYQGAMSFYAATIGTFGSSGTPTGADLQQMRACIEELRRFHEQMKAGTT